MKVFREIDKNGDGVLSFEEIANGFKVYCLARAWGRRAYKKTKEMQ